MTGESVRQTSVDSLQNQSLEKVIECLQDNNTAAVAVTDTVPNVPDMTAPAIPPRDRTGMQAWLIPILCLDPDNPPSGMTTPPPVVVGPAPRKAPGFKVTAPKESYFVPKSTLNALPTIGAVPVINKER